MKDDFRDFLDALRKSPLMGEPLGKHLRKVRKLMKKNGLE